ncbi:hypothetical protein RA278_27595, partial [Pseudomonas syringae pv. tagetis]
CLWGVVGGFVGLGFLCGLVGCGGFVGVVGVVLWLLWFLLWFFVFGFGGVVCCSVGGVFWGWFVGCWALGVRCRWRVVVDGFLVVVGFVVVLCVVGVVLACALFGVLVVFCWLWFVRCGGGCLFGWCGGVVFGGGCGCGWVVGFVPAGVCATGFGGVYPGTRADCPVAPVALAVPAAFRSDPRDL